MLTTSPELAFHSAGLKKLIALRTSTTMSALRERSPAASHFEGERGVSMVTTALVLPVLLAVLVASFDLVRLYLNGIYAQQVAILTAKLASSNDPAGYAMPDEKVKDLVLGAVGESDETIAARRAFWDLTSPLTRFNPGGKLYFTAHEKKVLNLAYGFARSLNPRIYFPIPAGLGRVGGPGVEALGGRPNCSIFFRYRVPPPAPLPAAGAPNYSAVVLADRDRTIHVECVVPLIALSLGGILSAEPYRVVERTAYAFESGNLKKEG